MISWFAFKPFFHNLPVKKGFNTINLVFIPLLELIYYKINILLMIRSVLLLHPYNFLINQFEIFILQIIHILFFNNPNINFCRISYNWKQTFHVIELFILTIDFFPIAAYWVIPIHCIHPETNSLNALEMLERNEDPASECVSLSQLRKCHEVLIFYSVLDLISFFVNHYSFILVSTVVGFHLVQYWCFRIELINSSINNSQFFIIFFLVLNVIALILFRDKSSNSKSRCHYFTLTLNYNKKALRDFSSFYQKFSEWVCSWHNVGSYRH